MLRCHERIAIVAAGQQTILDRRGVAELVNQEQTCNKDDQNNDNTDEARGLAVFHTVLCWLVQPWPMNVHAVLPDGLA